MADLLAWDVTTTDVVNTIGEDVINQTPQQIHNSAGNYKVGMIGAQMVVYRDAMGGELAGDAVAVLNAGEPNERTTVSYIPPTVPTEPIFE